MKKRTLVFGLLAVVLAFTSYADDGALRNKRILQLPTATPVSGDFIPFYDVSANDVRKFNASFMPASGGDITAGASGTAGTVNIFPGTASKGKVTLTTSDNSGNTTTSVNVAAQSGARTYTVPDAGASASFIMTQGAQTITGAKSFATSVLATGGVLDAGASGAAGTLSVYPTTAAKGKLTLTAADASGNTTSNVNLAAQSGARTYTIPDAGGSASFFMSNRLGARFKICGEGTTINNNSVAYGPSLTLTANTDNGLPCDINAAGDTTESNVDESLFTNNNFKVVGMVCRNEADANADISFTLHDDTAALSPSVTCTIADGDRDCVAAVSSEPATVAAGSKLAVIAASTSNIGDNNGFVCDVQVVF